MEPKKRTPILLWSAVEKLAALRTLTNTMFLWEDGPVTQYETWAEDANNLPITVVNSAKESQRSLFDALEKTHGVPRRAICCSAVHELVLAYPPQKLIPSTIFNSQGLVNGESGSITGTGLQDTLDAEATNFWQALVHHVICLADHKMATVEQSAHKFSELLLANTHQLQTSADATNTQLKLNDFLIRHFKSETRNAHHPDKPLGILSQGEKKNMPVNICSALPNLTREYEPERAELLSAEDEKSSANVRNIVVTHGKSSLEKSVNNHQKTAVKPKACKKGFLSYFHRFWTRKSDKH